MVQSLQDLYTLVYQRTEDHTMTWNTVCVGLFTHPDFILIEARYETTTFYTRIGCLWIGLSMSGYTKLARASKVACWIQSGISFLLYSVGHGIRYSPWT